MRNRPRFMIKPTGAREWDNALTLDEQKIYVYLYELLVLFVDAIIANNKAERMNGKNSKQFAKILERDWMEFEKVWREKLTEAGEYIIVYQFETHRYYNGRQWNVRDISIFWRKFLGQMWRMQELMEKWKKGQWCIKDIHEEDGLYFV